MKEKVVFFWNIFSLYPNIFENFLKESHTITLRSRDYMWTSVGVVVWEKKSDRAALLINSALKKYTEN